MQCCILQKSRKKILVFFIGFLKLTKNWNHDKIVKTTFFLWTQVLFSIKINLKMSQDCIFSTFVFKIWPNIKDWKLIVPNIPRILVLQSSLKLRNKSCLFCLSILYLNLGISSYKCLVANLSIHVYCFFL